MNKVHVWAHESERWPPLRRCRARRALRILARSAGGTVGTKAAFLCGDVHVIVEGRSTWWAFDFGAAIDKDQKETGAILTACFSLHTHRAPIIQDLALAYQHSDFGSSEL